MHRSVAILLAVLLWTCAAGAEPPASLATLAWLQGCWQDATAARVVEEHWMPPLGDSMAGLGRTVRGGRLLEFEAVVIRETPAGLVFEARPSGQAAATFAAASGHARAVVFENPAHDFPQRIGYESGDAATLLAWIEGPRDGRVRRIEFRYRRIPCP
jgi:hypothetical protein